MKVAFVHQPLGTLSIPVREGSIAIWVYEVARRLAKSNEVVVYTRKAREQADVETRDGVTYRRMSTELDEDVFRFFEDHPRLTRLFRNPKLPFFSRHFAHLQYELKVAWDLGLQGCDIIHIKNFSQFVPAIRVLNPRAKIVLHMQSYWLTQLDRSTIERRLRGCDAIACCSEHVAGQVRTAFPNFRDRCFVIHNGVDTESFLPDAQGRNHGNGTQHLLFVGRVSPEKGLHVLLEALADVVRRCPDARLTIVGPEWTAPLEFIAGLTSDVSVSKLARFYPGSYLAKLREMLAPELAAHVSFISNLPHPELVEIYRQADVLVNPSLLETFGMTLVEAMACGVPAVATRVGGMTEVIADGESGILVEPDDSAALADAIVRLLTNPDLRQSIAKAGRERVRKLFAWDKISERTLELHHELVEGRKMSDEWTSRKRGYASVQC